MIRRLTVAVTTPLIALSLLAVTTTPASARSAGASAQPVATVPFS
jgi:hypothetical protein